MPGHANIATICLVGLGALASALAQTAPAETAQKPAAQQFIVAQQFVNDKLAVWQQRLKLEDWQASVTLVHRSELPPKTLGGIKWDKTKKTAVIWVLDPSEYRLPQREMLDDMELTIVHELVHLDLTALPHGQASRSSEERAVNGIAQVMLKLDRKTD